VMTPPPQYRPMEPSPPRSLGSSMLRPSLPPFGAPYTPRSQVDLGRLAGPPKGITPFTVAGLVRTIATQEQERGSSAVEPLTRGVTDLTISDRRRHHTTEQICHHQHRTWQTLTLTGWDLVYHHRSHHSAIRSSVG
jgi:hypothetical protein